MALGWFSALEYTGENTQTLPLPGQLNKCLVNKPFWTKQLNKKMIEQVLIDQDNIEQEVSWTSGQLNNKILRVN